MITMTDEDRRAFRRAERAVEAAKASSARPNWCHAADVTFAAEYAEPGYSGSRIAFGDWNDEGDGVMPWLLRVLEKLGFECEWSDEWSTCSHCGAAFRTSPDSYSWTPSYVMGDGEIACAACVLDDPEGYLASCEDDPDTAVTLDVDPKAHGYFKPDDLSGVETGYHPGQDGDPRKVARQLRDKGITRFLFKIDSVGQFDSRWSVWIHEDERDDYLAAFGEEPPEVDGFSPSRGLQAALASIPARPEGEGVHVVTCDVATGTSTGRLVTPEEFIEGVKR